MAGSSIAAAYPKRGRNLRDRSFPRQLAEVYAGQLWRSGQIDARLVEQALESLAIDRGQRVLVHCRAGDRRTGGVIAAYWILVRGESKEVAYRELGRFAGSGSDGSLEANLPAIGLELAAQRARATSAPEPAS